VSRRVVTGGPVTAGVRLGAGGQAEVFAVAEDPTLAFKRYYPRHANAEAHQKLLVMTAHVPADPARGQGHASIAWPLDVVVTDAGAFEGFVMPRVDTTVAVPLFRFYNPAARQATAPSITWRYLLRLGANLASALEAVHRAGYVVGDLNESNALGTGTALVTLVDCDSVQVRDPTSGRVFHSPVGKPDYLAPELQGLDLATVARVPSSDNFSLAILLYLLLMEGAHPFMGVWKGAGEPPGVPERMRKAMFPPANAQLLGPAPIALPFATLPPELQRLFLRAFGAGIDDPGARPSAGEWQEGLVAAETGLVTCSASSSHVYSGHLSDCPWCRRMADGLGDAYRGSGSGQRALPPQPLTLGVPVSRQRMQPLKSQPQSTRPTRAIATPAPINTAASHRSGLSVSRWRRRPIGVCIGVLAAIIVFLLARPTPNGAPTAEDNTPPRYADGTTGGDHWHAAIGFNVCGTFLPDFSEGDDPVGIHTHGDGIVHIHPFNSEASGARATLQRYFDARDLTVEEGKLLVPGTNAKINGDLCGTEPGRVQVKTWDSRSSSDTGRMVTGAPGAVRLADNQLITIAFLPDGSEITKPPSEPGLGTLTDVPSSTATTPTTIPPVSVSTTVLQTGGILTREHIATSTASYEFRTSAINGISFLNVLRIASSGSPKTLEISAARGKTRFQGTLGIPDDQEATGRHRVEVRLDNQVPALSVTINSGDIKQIDLDVTNALRIRIIVSPETTESGVLAIGNPRLT
jgi:hypothetical protein